MPVPSGDAHAALERAWQDHWARLLALLVGRFRRLDLAEDALAEAFAAAVRTWPRDGTPDSPAAWLLTAARRRALDQVRAEAIARRREPLMVVDTEVRAHAAQAIHAGGHIPDERLRMLFTCCHPALSADARAALALRFVNGLSVTEIARLFLVQESTMAARLTRAKKKVAAAGIPFTLPAADRLAERLEVVAAVIYLVFTAGYAPATGEDPVRTSSAAEAIRLARLLDDLLPNQPVVLALLGLMTLQHSRRDARVAADGSLVLLPDQDRTRWHTAEIRSGLDLLGRVPPGTSGLALEYLLQARIAAEHAVAARAADTRWHRIATLYSELEALTGSPVVRLARAVAVLEDEGPVAGLALLAGLEERLPHHHRLPAVRAELLARAGRAPEAAASFNAAIALCGNAAERDHLRRRAAEVGEQAGRGNEPSG
ncbi:RNA polymerase sigma factor [Arthrobacter sp. CAN_C5]|uniref:RNA polymerase sigma factor n=1 Tax=Arthrobacter sp. CAN_C5 TaxID=2760706 RepID=UPI001AE5156D|nr:sigma-70 family RNA polymerase sigma factor [Arthrobacter sp. CAN_C5]MBP2215387.1 RNA polymerase sigma-70 factor (ECF subfamily) [Arthrobacter sp. CAN_C5]